jgi:hypothetical protein
MIIIKKRRTYFGCEILSRTHHFKKNAGGRAALKDFTNSHPYIIKIYGGCRQYNAPLCVHGDCWKVYHNAKKHI